MKNAVKALDSVDFDRTAKTSDIKTEDTVFAGNLIDPETGKLQAGRIAWETAADALLGVIASNQEIQKILEINGRNLSGKVSA